MTCHCSKEWPQVPCAKFPMCLFQKHNWNGLNFYWVSVAGSKLMWTYAYVTLTYKKGFPFCLKTLYWMSCNSFKNCIPKLYKLNSWMISKSANVKNNYLNLERRQQSKQSGFIWTLNHSFSLYKLILNDQAFHCTGGSHLSHTAVKPDSCLAWIFCQFYFPFPSII